MQCAYQFRCPNIDINTSAWRPRKRDLLGGFDPAYRCLLFDPAAERKDEDAEKEAAAEEEEEEEAAAEAAAEAEEGRQQVCDEKWKCDDAAGGR